MNLSKLYLAVWQSPGSEAERQFSLSGYTPATVTQNGHAAR